MKGGFGDVWSDKTALPFGWSALVRRSERSTRRETGPYTSRALTFYHDPGSTESPRRAAPRAKVPGEGKKEREAG